MILQFPVDFPLHCGNAMEPGLDAGSQLGSDGQLGH